jgi:hypothetical protein
MAREGFISSNKVKRRSSWELASQPRDGFPDMMMFDEEGE